MKFGYHLTINRISSNTSYEIFDKNSWQPYLNKKNQIFKIYENSIIKSKSKSSDSFQKQLRFYYLFNIVENIIKKKNYQHFVECGCWKGHSAFGISTILKKNNFNKNFYIFDSFEGGLSDKNKNDINSKRYTQSKEDILKQKKYFESSLTEVNNLLDEFNFVKIHKGWIPKVFNKIEKIKISFIHIDLDLYKPTYDTISYFFDNLESGGIIVCDDYNCSDFPGAKLAIDEFLKNQKYQILYETPLGGCIIIK